jgi:hypothetical protein
MRGRFLRSKSLGSFFLFIFVLLMLMAPSRSPASEPERTVYLGLRSDGSPGRGTSDNPYDASTASRFDMLMQHIAPNTQIILQPGVYFTRGADAFSLKPGWHIQGAGMGLTTIKLFGHYAPGQKHGHFTSTSRTDDVQIRNLTCDGNATGWKWPAHQVIGGIFVYGSRTLVENVEVVNCYGDSVLNQEQFSILTGGARGDPFGEATDCVIRNCWTHRYAPGANYTNGPLIACCKNALITGCRDDGSNHAFGFAGTINAQIDHCSTSRHTSVAYYIDTDSIDGLVIEHNSFPAALIPVQFCSQAPARNVTIHDNFLEAWNSTGSGSAGIVLCGRTGTDFNIIGNTFVYSGTNASGLILDNGSPFKELTIKGNMSNVGLVGAGGSDSDIKNAGAHLADNRWKLGSLAASVQAK